MEDQDKNQAKPPKKKKKGDKGMDLSFDKERAKLDWFDPRGVQTLFRTLSRNHYNLLRMIDGKASIVLTVNSIIISLLLGVIYIAPEPAKATVAFIARTLVQVSIVSMIFALLSMLPHRYVGKQYKNSGYRGSLYAANFAKQSLEEFEQEFERIMTSGKTVYKEMIKDLYFLGKAVAIKQKLLIISVVIFLVGLMGVMLYALMNGGIAFSNS
jgi:hypothetical protein